MKKAAYLFERQQFNRVRCDLCNHRCNVMDGQYGKCNVRKNENGELYAMHYGELCSAALDPIEKKPLYHFFPGSTTYSIAMPGCNMTCGFCQNWQISQVGSGEKDAGDLIHH